MTTPTEQNTAPDTSEETIKKLSSDLLKLHTKHQWLGGIPLLYLQILIADLTRSEALKGLLYFMLPYTVLLTAVQSTFYKVTVRNALMAHPGDAPGSKLTRILKIPGRIELCGILLAAGGAWAYVGGSVIVFGKSVWTLVWATAVVVLLSMLVTIQERIEYQRLLHPAALREFYRNPTAVPAAESGFLWPRQRWYLAYSFGLFVMSTLMITLTVIGRPAMATYEQLLQLAAHANANDTSQFSQTLQQTLANVLRDSLLPVILFGIYLLGLAAISAWRISKHQAEGINAVRRAMEALAKGAPELPRWVATDEVGELSFTTAQAFEQLKAFSLSLGESAQELMRSAQDLGLSTSKQSEVITLQATALQETQVTAQEIKQTSILAAQKAESVLQQTEAADNISNAGEQAIQRSLNGLQEIGDQVREMAKRIKALDERTQQIANITTTVKDLADQSNMLALNAAIEAVRSGEHGKGFGVVAREIRALADQSIQATNNVREILQDISNAIRSTVAITEKGSEKIESSLVQVREFGTNIRQLSSIVRDNAASVRQITAAVAQQNAGIGQIFTAVSDLSKLMDQTVNQLRASDNALVLVRNVTDKVSSFVGAYGWEEMHNNSDAPEHKQ